MTSLTEFYTMWSNRYDPWEKPADRAKLCLSLDAMFTSSRATQQPAWSIECALLLERLLPQNSEAFYRSLRETRIALEPKVAYLPHLKSGKR